MTSKINRILDTCKGLLYEPHTISLWIFRLLIIFGGYVISAEWIKSGSSLSFFYLLSGITVLGVLMSVVVQFGKTFPKRNTKKLILIRIWIALLAGVISYGSVGSIDLLMFDGFAKLSSEFVKDGYYFWKPIADLFFDLVLPVYGFVSIFQIKYTIRKWKNRFGPAFPSLAWI